MLLDLVHLIHISRTDNVLPGRKDECEQSVTTPPVENEDLGAPKMSTARVAVLLGTIWVSHRPTLCLSFANTRLSNNARFPTPR